MRSSKDLSGHYAENVWTISSSSMSSISERYSPSLSSTTTWRGRTGHCASRRRCQCCARSRDQCDHGRCSAVYITCTSEQPDHQRTSAPLQVTRCASALSAVACIGLAAGNACIQASIGGYSSGAEGTRILRVLRARHPQFPASRALLLTHSCPLLWAEPLTRGEGTAAQGLFA